MSVAVVTDTVACLPDDLARRYDITVIPLQIIHKGVTYLDGIEMTPGRFYEILATSNELPTTSAATPEAYVEIYRKLIDSGRQIVVICPSHRLTHVFESATLAANVVRESHPQAVISVIDSGTAAGAQGFVALDAAARAQAGASLAEVTEIATKTMERVHIIVFLDTLDYLVKGGRVPYILGWANAILQIKPMIELRPLGEGVVPLHRVRTRPRAMQKLMQVLQGRLKNTPVRVVVHHTNCGDEAIALQGYLKASLNCLDIYIRDFTPVMGLHTGPGLMGVAYCTEESI